MLLLDSNMNSSGTASGITRIFGLLGVADDKRTLLFHDCKSITTLESFRKIIAQRVGGTGIPATLLWNRKANSTMWHDVTHCSTVFRERHCFEE